jgi:MFS family permease
MEDRYPKASVPLTLVQSKHSLSSWLIWGLAAAFFLSEYFARIAPGIMVPELMRVFKVNALSLGSMSAIFYTAYVGMQLPVGTLVDRYGPHRLLTITAVICALGCFLFASSNYLALAQISRFMMGFGAAFAFVGTLKLATIWFPATRFGFLSGLTQALGMIGGAASAGPLAMVEHAIGWKGTMWGIGFVLLLLGVLIGLFVRDQTKAAKPSEKVMAPKKVGFWQSFAIVLKNPQSWLNAAFAALAYASTAAFAELWGTTYLSQVHSVDRTTAANAVSFVFIGLAIGCPIAGWISDRIRRRIPIMRASVLLSLFLLSFALYLPNLSVITLFVLFFLYGVTNSGFVTAYAVASEINSREVAGTSMGFANMASVVGASFQPIIGWFLDMQWSGELANGVPVYSAQAFRHSMIALPLCFAVALLVSFFIKETHCKFVER